MALKVIEMVLPVLVLLVLGSICNQKQIFDHGGLLGIKAVISDICLPVVLFNAFFTANYSLRLVLVLITMYVCYGTALLLGFLLKKLATPHGRFFPLLLTCAEGGMLGYALYGVLTGDQSGFATVDIGNTLFAYTVFLAALKSADGQKLTGRAMVRNMLTNKCCVGMLLGILGGASGLGTVVLSGSIGGVFQSVIGMIAAPTSAMVLLVVGYELNLKKELLAPVLKTVLCRLVVMGALLCAASFVIFRVVPFDKNLQIAMMVIFSLPAPFIIPFFADVGDDAEYISTTLSVHTLCSIALFALIAVYSLA